MATPSHVDLSVLWVPIMPETSKLGPEMEKAGKQATEDFGRGSSGLGDKIHDSFTKSTEKVKGVFSKAGSDAGESMSDSFKQKTKGIEDAAAESGHKAGGALVESFVSKTGGLKDFSEKLGDQVGGALGGKIGEALKNIPGVGGAVDALQKVGDKAKDVGADFDTVKGGVENFGKMMEGLPGKLGAVAGVLGEISFAIAGAVTAAKEINKLPWVQHWFNDDNGVPKSGIERWADKLPFGIGDAVRGLTGDQLPGSNDFYKGWYPAPTAADGDAPAGPKVYGPPGPGGKAPAPPGPGRSPAPNSSFYKDWYGSGTDSDSGPSVSKWGRSLTTPDSSGTDWDAIAQGESGGDWSINSGNGYYGGLQFDLKTWKDFGGLDFAERPDLASREDQIAVAERVPAGQRARRWPNTYSLGAPPSGSSAGGGGVGRSAGVGRSSSSTGSYGLPPGTDIRQGAQGFPSWVYRLGQQFGLQASTYAGHQETERPDIGAAPNPQHLNRGIDWWGSQENMDRFAAFLQQTGLAEQVIHKDPGTGQTWGFPANVDYSGNYGEETTMVHTRFSRAPGGMGSGPTGKQHDPLYVMPADSGSGGGSSTQSQAAQFGSGFLGGIMQSIGLDGSVFKGFGGASNPMQFGSVKAATGLLNWGLGMAQQRGAGLPGMGGSVPVGPNGAQNVSTGDTHIYNAPVGGLNVTQNVPQGTGMQDLQHGLNGPLSAGARYPGLGNVPNAGAGLNP